MKKTIFLFLAGIVCLCAAGSDKPIDTSAYFDFPRAVIVMEFGDANHTKATSKCSQSFADSTAQEPEAHNFGMGFGIKNGLFVRWEFVKKTLHGDVYLIIMEQPGKPKTVIPAVFDGKEQTVVATSDLTVRILPEDPKEK